MPGPEESPIINAQDGLIEESDSIDLQQNEIVYMENNELEMIVDNEEVY